MQRNTPTNTKAVADAQTWKKYPIAIGVFSFSVCKFALFVIELWFCHLEPSKFSANELLVRLHKMDWLQFLSVYGIVTLEYLRPVVTLYLIFQSGWLICKLYLSFLFTSVLVGGSFSGLPETTTASTRTAFIFFANRIKESAVPQNSGNTKRGARETCIAGYYYNNSFALKKWMRCYWPYWYWNMH